MKTINTTRRQFLGRFGGGALAMAVAVVGLMAATAPTTQAAQPQRVFIDIHDFTVSDDTSVGTFESTGAIETSGPSGRRWRPLPI